MTATPIDPWLRSAVMSSLTPDNLPTVAAEILKHDDARQAWLVDLLGQAAAMKSEATIVSLVTTAVDGTSQPQSAWPWQALAQMQAAATRRGKMAAWELPTAAHERLRSCLPTARARALQGELDPAVRVAAVGVLGWQGEDRTADAKLAPELLSPREAPVLQTAALQLAARTLADEFGPLCVARWRTFGPGLRTEAAQLLAERPAAVLQLLHAVEAENIAVSLIDAALRQRLLTHTDDKVKSAAAKLFHAGTNAERQQAVAAALQALANGGDVSAGAEVFRQKCAACHKLGEVGFAVGPDLASLTDKSPTALLTAILDPNLAVETKYLAFQVVTGEGRQRVGLLVEVTSSSLTLRGAVGKDITLLRRDIDELQASNKSFMPEGFQKELSPKQLADLVAFIRGNIPLRTRKAFPKNEPQVVTADKAGKLLLHARHAEIFGSTLVLEEKYENLGYWSSLDDEAHWRIVVPQGGKYRVAWEWACDRSAAGHRCRIEGGSEPLVVTVKATDHWDDYRSEEVGVIELAAGEQRLTLRPDKRPLPALMDLRVLTLTPVK
jgi:putative heme-binding domain-containing protein